jgi:hypothetical protein
MPFGKPAPKAVTTSTQPATPKTQVERKGTVDTNAVYSERGHVMRTEKTHKNLDTERVDVDFALVNTGHTVKMSIGFQTVETTCVVTLPAANDPTAIKKKFKQAWQLVEEELNGRQAWAKDVIDALNEAREAHERK